MLNTWVITIKWHKVGIKCYVAKNCLKIRHVRFVRFCAVLFARQGMGCGTWVLVTVRGGAVTVRRGYCVTADVAVLFGFLGVGYGGYG